MNAYFHLSVRIIDLPGVFRASVYDEAEERTAASCYHSHRTAAAARACGAKMLKEQIKKRKRQGGDDANV